MAKIKALNTIAAKWTRRAASAGPEYLEGVKNPRADWATETKAAERAYEAGVNAAIGRKAFGKGVSNAGTETWQRNAIEKGPGRFTQGINLSTGDYEAGFAPYRDVIANTQLPARGPKGDPQNIQRVSVLAEALHAKKLSLEG